MNRYIVIDFKDNTIYNTEDLKHLTEDTFDRFGSSISCVDKEDLIQELSNLIEELKEDK